MEIVKNRLREILGEWGVKHVWICKKVGMHQTTFNRILKGEMMPSIRFALKISRVLNIPVEEIFWLEEEKAPEE